MARVGAPSDYKNVLGTVTRRLPLWSPNDPGTSSKLLTPSLSSHMRLTRDSSGAGFSHLLSMQAYGLQADGKLDAAESLAEKAISMNGNDRWACTSALEGRTWSAR